jgi:hypothetical protein
MKVSGVRERTQYESDYISSSVALESAGVDLDICVAGINCSALRVVQCPPPGIGAQI